MASLISWLAFAGARKTDGTAVASGNAYFYQPDTVSTPITVYSDEDGTAAITQPVTLDAAGKAIVYTRVPAKVRVEDSLGVLVEVEDRANTVMAAHVEVENSSFIGTHLTLGTQVAGGRIDLDTILTRLGSSLGGTDGKYKEDGATTSRDLNDVVGQYITLEDFGGVGDDATDCTAALSSAISRCLASGKPLRLEVGTYRVNGVTAISSSSAIGLEIIGSSRGKSTIKQMSTTADTFTLSVGGAVESHVRFIDFAITAGTTTSGTAIKVTAGNGVQFERVSTALHRVGFDVSATNYADIRDCLVISTDGNAAGFGFKFGAIDRGANLRVDSAATGVAFSLGGHTQLSRCTAVTAATAYQFNGAFGCTINCYSQATTGYSFLSSDCVAYSCYAAAATTGYSVGAVARSGAIACYSAATTDFTTNASATAIVDAFNFFTNRTHNEYAGQQVSRRQTVGTKYRQSSTSNVGVNFSYTPDPSQGEYQILSWAPAVGGAGGTTCTVNATSTTGLQNGQRMTLIFEVLVTGGGALTLSFNAQYVGVSAPFNQGTGSYSLVTALANSTSAAITVVWNSSTSKWVWDHRVGQAVSNSGSQLWGG